MNRAGYLALKKSMKPAIRTVLLTSIADEPTEISFGHPEAGAVIPGLAANPVLLEFLFNETEEGKQAMTEFTLDSVIGMFKKMGPFAISAIIAASMRDVETRQSLAGDAEIEAWIRDWSPADQIKALITIHEVTNLVDFFALLWSLAQILPVGQAMQSAMQSALSSTSDGDLQPNAATSKPASQPSSSSGHAASAKHGKGPLANAKETALVSTANMLPFDSGAPAPDSAEAA